MNMPMYQELEDKALELAVQLANAESKCRELAAENSGLKDTLSAVIDRSNEPDYQSIGMGCGVEDNGLQTDGYNACEYGWREAMDRIYSEVIPDALPETPATDAYLAEVRVQGVEMFAERKNNAMMSLHPDTHAVGSIAAAMSAEVKELREFAAQLRQGAEQ